MPDQTLRFQGTLLDNAGHTSKVYLTLTYVPPVPVVVGANHGGYADVAGAVSPLPLMAYRGYKSGIPAAWSGEPLGVTCPTVNLAIKDVAGTASGKYDAELAAYFRQVPNGALVTIDGEYEAQRYPYTPVQVISAIHNARAIFKANAPAGAKFGQNVGSYTANPKSKHYPLSQWIVSGLDFYALDGYQDNQATTPAGVFGPDVEQVRSVEPNAVFAIFETNSAFPGQVRADWFKAAYAWAKETNCLTFISFWNAQYAWDSQDTATINSLSVINADSQS